MPAAWHFENDTIRIKKLEVGTFGNNTYVVACRKTNESIVVDAASDPDRIVALTEGTSPIAILTTHGHPGHVGAARRVAQDLGVPIRLNEADWEICPIAIDEHLPPGDVIVGRATLRAVHTPGHTPGSTCLLSDGVAITGDTLFPGGPGATRFPYSDFDQIMESLDRELFVLPDETVVMPGHGLDTTIGNERPSLPEWRARRW